jgi:exopolysaccharide biosynthesis polyprenyl glycosylphosphotransferase
LERLIKRLPNFYGLRRPLSVLILMIVDALALLGGLVLAGYLLDGAGRSLEVLYLAPILLTGWLAIFAAHDLYERAPTRRNPGSLLGAFLWGVGLLTIGSVIYPQSGFSLGEIFLGAFFALVLDGGLRLLYEQGIELIYRRGYVLIPTLLVGEDAERARVRRIMEYSPSAYALVGELALNDARIDFPVLRRGLDETGARQVVVAGAERLADKEFLDFLRACRLRRVRVKVVPSAVTLMGGNSTFSQDSGVPLLEMRYPRLDNTQRALKRMLDVVVSLGGLLVLSPLLLTVAALIKLTSPGPVLFGQKRVGADEKVFTCYKFRSMYADAEKRQAELEAENEAEGAIFKIKNDPRVTLVGRFIRRWSIDELPQLINVLFGEMSLVGPRPLPLRDFERMGEMHKKRLAAVPGITGYWQTSGRSDLSFEDMVRLDLYYIENWSLSLDIKIIFKTVGAVLRQEGAY